MPVQLVERASQHDGEPNSMDCDIEEGINVSGIPGLSIAQSEKLLSSDFGGSDCTVMNT